MMITSIPTFGSSRPELAILITAPVEFLAEPRLPFSATFNQAIAVQEAKRFDTKPLRYAEPVALTCPDFIGWAAEPGCPRASWS